MKIILTAFGDKLRSEPIEFPDETPPTIHLALDIDTTKFSFEDEGLIPDKPTLKRGEFVAMAHSELLSDNKTLARRYTLVNIS